MKLRHEIYKMWVRKILCRISLPSHWRKFDTQLKGLACCENWTFASCNTSNFQRKQIYVLFTNSCFIHYMGITLGFLIRACLSLFITAQKIKFSIKGFFSKCDQTCSFMRIWSYLLKTYLMENFIFCTVHVTELNTEGKWQDCRRAFSVISRMQGSFCFFRLVE